MVNMKETIIEITVIAVGVLAALYLMNYMGYIQHNSGGIKNAKVIEITNSGNGNPASQPTQTQNSNLAWTGSD